MIDPCTFTIFGATGDLTHRKLLPALYFLESEENLDQHIKVLCVARKELTTAAYRKQTAESIKYFSRIPVNNQTLKRLLSRIQYVSVDFSRGEDYARYKKAIHDAAAAIRGQVKHVFYLAVSPEYFEIMVNNLVNKTIISKKKHDHAIVFEKPFGRNLESATALNKSITTVFAENQIYRIDHYLGKELVQNLMVLRFGNTIFEPLWNKEFIDHVQITVAETLGVETRAGYYDKSGSLRDILQNHIMQLISLVAMESPKNMQADSIRDKKVKALRDIELSGNLLKTSLKGQYQAGTIDGQAVSAYRDENGIDKTSVTDTFFACKLKVENMQWRGVPFYVRTGKRLKGQATEIVIVYKSIDTPLFRRLDTPLKKNMLLIRVQPDQGITFQFNAKAPSNKMIIEDVRMDFCHECTFGPNSPEAYERLLYDVIRGDQTLFTRWDEVRESWRIVDQLAEVWKNKQPLFYAAGSWGPDESDLMIQKDKREWIIPKKPQYAMQGLKGDKQ